jgi:hypothetical protein
MARVGVKIPQDGIRTTVVHGHDWRTLCSICATGARVSSSPCHAARNSFTIQEQEKLPLYMYELRCSWYM